MVEIKDMKENSKCVATFTMRVIRPTSGMRVGNKVYKISRILHIPTSQ